MFEQEKFSLSAEYDGIYLSCKDKESGFEEPELYAFLSKYGVDRYDFQAIRKFIKDGKTCKICLRSDSLEKEAQISVEVSKDKMLAMVSIQPPFFSKPWPSEYKVKEALASRGVKFGINDVAIDAMLAGKTDNEPIPLTVVAEGEPPIDGTDARIEIIRDPDKPLEVSDDEKIDFWSRSTIVTVHPGEEIARKYPAKPGRNGTDVTGAVVKPRPVKNLEFSFGEGLERDGNDNMLLVATTDGQLKNERGKLVVLPELDIHKDIDFAVGSIDFTGAVKVHGDVRDGFHVVANGNIEIFGSVEGSDIDAKGNVIIHGGVRGVGKGTITAVGDVCLNFADQATVRSSGTIIANNAILHSDLYAHTAVMSMGSRKKSQIAGGHIEAGLEVSCSILGSEMGTRTEVVVGVPPEMLEKRKILSDEVKRCEENLEKIEPNLALLKKLETAGQLDDKKRATMMDLTKMKFQLQAARDTAQGELNPLLEELELLKNKGIVRVKDTCYPGVVIFIRGLSYIVNEPLKYVGFIADDDSRSIRLVSFDYMSGRMGG